MIDSSSNSKQIINAENEFLFCIIKQNTLTKWILDNNHLRLFK